MRVLDVEAIWLRPATDVAALEGVLETCAALGAHYLLTVGNDPERARLIENLGRLADSARGYGVELAIEFIPYTEIRSVADAWAVIGQVGRPNVHVLIDALQFFRREPDLTLVESLPAEHLPYAQICDGPLQAPRGLEALRREARTDRALPGRGELDLRGLLDALPQGITLSVEAPHLGLADLGFDVAAREYARAVEEFLDRVEESR
jgi:sugar phosphate isomerase/epimerase